MPTLVHFKSSNSTLVSIYSLHCSLSVWPTVSSKINMYLTPNECLTSPGLNLAMIKIVLRWLAQGEHETTTVFHADTSVSKLSTWKVTWIFGSTATWTCYLCIPSLGAVNTFLSSACLMPDRPPTTFWRLLQALARETIIIHKVKTFLRPSNQLRRHHSKQFSSWRLEGVWLQSKYSFLADYFSQEGGLRVE